MSWQELVKFLGGGAMFAAVIGYIAKISIEAYLSNRLTDHKASLEKITHEHAVRFSRLHSERAEMIKGIYQRLVSLDEIPDSTLRQFQHIAEPKLEDKVKSLGDSFNNLRNYFLPNRIFFEETTCGRIDRILDSSKSIYHGITAYPVDPTGPDYKVNRDLLNQRHEFWERARCILNDAVLPLKRELENEFRQLLGINA